MKYNEYFVLNITIKEKNQLKKLLVLNKILHSTMSPNTEGTYGPDSKVSELKGKPFNANMGKY